MILYEVLLRGGARSGPGIMEEKLTKFNTVYTTLMQTPVLCLYSILFKISLYNNSVIYNNVYTYNTMKSCETLKMYFQCVAVALQHNYGFLLIIILKVYYCIVCL